MTVLHHRPLDGPWQTAFVTEIPGRPRSKANARRFTRAPQEQRAYQAANAYRDTVSQLLDLITPHTWQLGPPPPSPVDRRPIVLSVIVARTTLDATNIPKTLHDAAEGRLYHTDSSVRSATQLTVRTTVDRGSVAGFAQLPAGTALVDIAAAHTALIDRTVVTFTRQTAAS